MPYGIIKIDTVTFTDAGVDKSVTLSGLVQNPTFSGNVTVTGTLSGVTVTGTTANFTSGNFTNISGGTHTITSGVFAAGSAASPSITFTGDLNTGIYSPGADQVAISTGGSGRLFVDASGNVGVGVSASAWGGSWKTIEFLNGHSFGSAGTQAAVGQNLFNNGSNWIYKTSAPASFYQLNAGEHIWYSAPSGTAGNSVSLLERLRITSAGLVGVGTSSPGTLVEGRITGGGGTPATSGTSQPNAVFRVSGSGTTGVLDIGCNSGAPWIQSTDRTDLSQKYSLLLNPNGGSVGIGTSSPSALLSVALTTTSYTAESFNIGEPSLSTGRQLYMGYNTADGVGFIQPVHWGTEFKPLVLCPNGGKVGIGTTSPGDTLHVSGSIRADVDLKTINQGKLNLGSNHGGGAVLLYNPNGNLDIAPRSGYSTTFLASDGGTERARIDSSGRLLVGTSTERTNVFADLTTAVTPAHQVETLVNNSWSTGLSIINNSSAGYAPVLTLGLSCANSVGSNTLVPDGNTLGRINFAGNDGTNFVCGARIAGETDGTTGSGDLPSRLVFSTTADGASSPTERMRIQANGVMRFGQTTTDTPAAANVIGAALAPASYLSISRSADLAIEVNRQTNDGALMRFLQDGTEEGNISVSGTTVSYNGAHLSRWSQLPSGAERTEILRGSVLSNIDEMCEWGNEENEQLNRMKVSDVEGDKNVSGVFQGWDDDDDTYTNDFYCAMTGDFIIRIAQGVTVERGDLLMSAGDGTAKPQDDDIIRSKTIAKVTSTNVSCTYDDGSYCVPCVLMAC